MTFNSPLHTISLPDVLRWLTESLTLQCFRYLSPGGLLSESPQPNSKHFPCLVLPVDVLRGDTKFKTHSVPRAHVPK